MKHAEPWLLRLAHWLHRPASSRLAMRFRALTLAGAVAVAVAGVALAWAGVPAEIERGRHRAERAIRLAGVSVEQAAESTADRTAAAGKFPGRDRVWWSRIGHGGSVATIRWGIELSDVGLSRSAPRTVEKGPHSRRGAAARMNDAARSARPNLVLTQPIEMRMNRDDCRASVPTSASRYGDDFDTLTKISFDDIRGRRSPGIRGVGDVSGEQITGQPVLQVKVDPEAIARFGVCYPR